MSQIIIANIKIPIEITRNKEFNYLNEYAQISFEECDKLPKKQDSDINELLNKLINNKFNDTEDIEDKKDTEDNDKNIRIRISDNMDLNNDTAEVNESTTLSEINNESKIDTNNNNNINEPRIYIEEIIQKKPKKSYNTSFKNKKYNSTKYSVKNL